MPADAGRAFELAPDLDRRLPPPETSDLPSGFGCNREPTERLFPLFGSTKGHMRSGATALAVAAAHGRDGVVDHLLKAGADPNATDDAGRTASQIAGECGQNRLAGLLREAESA
jgi:hypothetical protein